jgi:hypothetical protein
MFDRVQHGRNLARLCLCFIIFIAIATAIHADQFNDIETNEALSDQLKQQSEPQKTASTN